MVKNFKKPSFGIAVVGATGVVGRQIVNLLYEMNFPYNNVYALGRADSKYDYVDLGDEELKVEALDSFDFTKVDFVFSAVSSSATKGYVKKALDANCLVIDNSSAFRETNDLIVPEINIDSITDKLEEIKQGLLITSPNCIAIPTSMILAPLQKEIGLIKRVVISTYQAVAGSGLNGMRELITQTKQDVMGNQNHEPKHFQWPIAFNLFPQIGDINPDTGASGEEEKIMSEVKKLVGENINISVTAVRVPVFLGHSAAVNIEFEDKVNVAVNQVYTSLKNAQGLQISPPNTFEAAMPVEVEKNDNVIVSRVRTDNTCNGINLWFTVNCIRKGGALNSVLIAQRITQIIKKS